MSGPAVTSGSPRIHRDRLGVAAQQMLFGAVPIVVTMALLAFELKVQPIAVDFRSAYFPAAVRLLNGGSPYAGATHYEILEGYAFVYPALRSRRLRTVCPDQQDRRPAALHGHLHRLRARRVACAERPRLARIRDHVAVVSCLHGLAVGQPDAPARIADCRRMALSRPSTDRRSRHRGCDQPETIHLAAGALVAGDPPLAGGRIRARLRPGVEPGRVGRRRLQRDSCVSAGVQQGHRCALA